MIKAVIFDLDGTLLDTRQDLVNSINLTLKSLNKNEMSQNEIISHVGNGIKNLVEACVLPSDQEQANKALILFKKFYDGEYMKNTNPYQGMTDLVKYLNDREIKIGVNSNKDDKYTKELIKKHFVDIDLKYVIGNKENIERKPSSQGIEIILNNMGINKEDAIYIGDSIVDINTARNAKITCLCVAWGFRKKEELIKEGDNILVNNPNEIIEYIKEKNNA